MMFCIFIHERSGLIADTVSCPVWEVEIKVKRLTHFSSMSCEGGRKQKEKGLDTREKHSFETYSGKAFVPKN